MGTSSGLGCTFRGGWNKSSNKRAATAAVADGMRNRLLKLSTFVPATVVRKNTFSPSQGHTKLPTNGPAPRIRKLNNPCALERASLGKYSSTKMYTVAKKKA